MAKRSRREKDNSNEMKGGWSGSIPNQRPLPLVPPIPILLLILLGSFSTQEQSVVDPSPFCLRFQVAHLLGAKGVLTGTVDVARSISEDYSRKLQPDSFALEYLKFMCIEDYFFTAVNCNLRYSRSIILLLQFGATHLPCSKC